MMTATSPFFPLLTVSMASWMPKSRFAPLLSDAPLIFPPVVPPVHKIAPEAMVKVWLAAIRTLVAAFAKTSELIDTDSAASVSVLVRTLVPAVKAFWVNSSFRFRGRSPVSAL